MKQEDKKLLLADLCARLPYGVKILYEGWDCDRDCEFATIEELIGIDDRFIYTIWRDEKDKHSIKEPLSITDYKPYLRPMSSMTEEEEENFNEFIVIVDDIWKDDLKNGIPKQSNIMSDGIDYLNSIHIDYRGLIPKGLAIEAPEGMYES